MASTHDDDLSKKRRAEERKLIEEIRYKRSCVRRAPTFPSAEEIQCKIRRFLSIVVKLVKFNNLVETFTELRGSRPQLFARREAALYRCRLERVHYEASNLMERIRSAAETLSIAYDLYGLLVLADDTLSDEREDFYDDWEEGVIIRPCFSADFICKEVEFIDDFRRKVENEIKEAELQEKSENHASLFDQFKEFFAELRRESEEKHEELRGQLKSMIGSIEGIKVSMERLREHHGETSDQKCNSEDREPTRPHGDNSMPPSRNQGEGDPRDAEKHQEPEEDLLDLYDNYEVIDDHEEAGNQGTNHGSRDSFQTTNHSKPRIPRTPQESGTGKAKGCTRSDSWKQKESTR
ncbi:hypothetical protein RB195_020544 [Necator americanus]|uniref:Uncharacterized protein n=1 Tax=Necator americanus TaxID=51031 RepID=A0ABR1CK83_NECAM